MCMFERNSCELVVINIAFFIMVIKLRVACYKFNSFVVNFTNHSDGPEKAAKLAATTNGLPIISLREKGSFLH